MKRVRCFAFLSLFVFGLAVQPIFADAVKYKVAIVVKSLGNGFFDAVRDGALEAAKEL